MTDPDDATAVSETDRAAGADKVSRVPRYRSPKGYLVLELGHDDTFTLWAFDESEPFVRTWNIYAGRVAAAPDRLVLCSTTKTRYVDGDSDRDTTEFVVTVEDGVPTKIEAFGSTLALAVEPRSTE